MMDGNFFDVQCLLNSGQNKTYFLPITGNTLIILWCIKEYQYYQLNKNIKTK